MAVLEICCNGYPDDKLIGQLSKMGEQLLTRTRAAVQIADVCTADPAAAAAVQLELLLAPADEAVQRTVGGSCQLQLLRHLCC